MSWLPRPERLENDTPLSSVTGPRSTGATLPAGKYLPFGETPIMIFPSPFAFRCDHAMYTFPCPSTAMAGYPLLRNDAVVKSWSYGQPAPSGFVTQLFGNRTIGTASAQCCPPSVDFATKMAGASSGSFKLAKRRHAT